MTGFLIAIGIIVLLVLIAAGYRRWRCGPDTSRLWVETPIATSRARPSTAQTTGTKRLGRAALERGQPGWLGNRMHVGAIE